MKKKIMKTPVKRKYGMVGTMTSSSEHTTATASNRDIEQYPESKFHFETFNEHKLLYEVTTNTNTEKSIADNGDVVDFHSKTCNVNGYSTKLRTRSENTLRTSHTIETIEQLDPDECFEYGHCDNHRTFTQKNSVNSKPLCDQACDHHQNPVKRDFSFLWRLRKTFSLDGIDLTGIRDKVVDKCQDAWRRHSLRRPRNVTNKTATNLCDRRRSYSTSELEKSFKQRKNRNCSLHRLPFSYEVISIFFSLIRTLF